MANGVSPYAMAGPSGTGASGASGGWWQGLGNALSGAMKDPNNQQFLAQLGTALDPQGAGGTIGQPTSQMIERDLAAQESSRLASQRQAYMNALMEALGGNNRLTGAKVNTDGSMELSGEAGEGSELGSLSESTLETGQNQNQQPQENMNAGGLDQEFDQQYNSILSRLTGMLGG